MKEDQFVDLKDWLEAQKLCWQSLLDGDPDATSDWRALSEACRRLAEQQLPPQNAELAGAMTEQAKGFCRYGEQLLRALRDPDNAPSIEEAATEFSDHLQNQAAAALLQQWQLPEQLQTFFSGMGIETTALPGFPFFQQGIGSGQNHWRERLKQTEENLQEFREALKDYFEIQQQLNRSTNHRLIATLKQENQINSLSDLHQCWVDHFEQGYQELLATEHYQQNYGRLSNASLTLKKQFQSWWEQESRQFGLVPVSDFDRLLERHHKLRKEFRRNNRNLQLLEERLRKLASDTELRQQKLEQELHDLKQQLTTNRKKGAGQS